jgi:hypothetical protein
MTEPLPRAAHAEHLTDAFLRTGALKDGRVRDVVVESSRPEFMSNIIRLCLAYDGAANGPSSGILKTGSPHTGGLPAEGHQEVAFYAQVASAMSGRFVPRCFEARILTRGISESKTSPIRISLRPRCRCCQHWNSAIVSLPRGHDFMPSGGTIPVLASPWGLGSTPLP